MANVLITINGDDQSTAAFNEAKANFKSLSTAALALGPAMAPVAAAATAAVAGLASTLGGAAVAVSAFKLAVAPQMESVKAAADAQEKYNQAVEQYGKDSKQAQTALAAYKTSMDGMPAATQATAKEFVGLKSDFKAWSDGLADNTMPIFTKGIQILRDLLPTLTPIVEHLSKILDGLMTKLKAKIESKGFDEFKKKFQDWANGGIDKVVGFITTLATKVSGFVMGEGFKQFLAMGKESGGNIATILQKLAQFMGEFLKAAGPLAGLSFAALGFLADALNAIPQSVLEILAPTIMAIVTAIKAWRLAVMAYTAVQWLMNAAISANPIGILIIAVIALVAAIVALWNKNEGFRKAVIAAWDAIKKGLGAAWDFIKNNIFEPLKTFFTKTIPGWAHTLHDKVIDAWNAIKKGVSTALTFLKNLFLNWTGPGLIIKHWNSIKEGASKALGKIRQYWDDFMSFFRKLPGKIANAASGMWNGIKSGFKTAVNYVIGAWNGLSFKIGGQKIFGKTLPSFTLNTPNLPYLARGGIASGLAMVGERGRELVDLPSGSHVRSAADTDRLLSRGGSGGVMHITLQIGDRKLGELLVDPIRHVVRTVGGGDVQAAFGRA